MRSSRGLAQPDGPQPEEIVRPTHHPGSTVHVVLGDVQRAFVEALALQLDSEPGLRVVAAAAYPHEVERAVRSQHVDVAVLTGDHEGEDFVALGGELLLAYPAMSLVAVAGNDDAGALARAVRVGFRAWVPKEAGVPVLIQAVHAVRRGETWIPPLLLSGLVERLLHGDDERRAAAEPLALLTVRERDVLRALTRGASRHETAELLGVSSNTLRTHVRSILRKLGVHSTLAAVAMARRAGIA